MFARFDKNPAMTLQDIKETKCYVLMHAWTHGQRENSIHITNKVCEGIATTKKFAGGITTDLVLLSLFMRINGKCNNSHAP